MGSGIHQRKQTTLANQQQQQRQIEHTGEPTTLLGRRACGVNDWNVVQKRLYFPQRRRVPKVRAKSSTGTLLPLLGAAVTISNDKEIETIDLAFRIELGLGYLSIMSIWNLDMETVNSLRYQLTTLLRFSTWRACHHRQ